LRYALKDFELHISAATTLAAETLLAEGAVRTLQEVERHFWIAKVTDDEERYEVETIITPGKIKGYTCECWSEPRKTMCKHIAAALLKIRQYLDKKAEERKEREEKAAEAAAGRLTVVNILEQVPAVEVVEFVRQYARQDRDFALALKAQFAGALPQGGDAFVLLIQSVIPVKSTLETMREAEFKRLNATVTALKGQAETAVLLAHYAKLLAIADAFTTEIMPLLKETDNERKRTPMLCAEVSAVVKHVTLTIGNGALAPEIKQGSWQILEKIAAYNQLHPAVYQPLWPFFWMISAQKTYFKKLQVLFDQTNFPASPFLLFWMTGALARKQQPKSVARTLKSYQKTPELWYAALLRLYEDGLADAFIAASESIQAGAGLQSWQVKDIEKKRRQILPEYES
jgi:hypothetical protein